MAVFLRRTLTKQTQVGRNVLVEEHKSLTHTHTHTHTFFLPTVVLSANKHVVIYSSIKVKLMEIDMTIFLFDLLFDICTKVNYFALGKFDKCLSTLGPSLLHEGLKVGREGQLLERHFHPMLPAV